MRFTEPQYRHAMEMLELGRQQLEPAGGIKGAIELVKALKADLVICGWGSAIPSLADLTRVPKDFVAEARRQGKPLLCFGVNADGNPKHPLYLPKDAALVPYPPLPDPMVPS